MWRRRVLAVVLALADAQASNFLADRDDEPTIASGDAIFLQGVAGDGHISVDGEAQTVWFNKEQVGSPPLFIKKAGGGLIHSGDVVHLVSYRGHAIDVEDSEVQSRWKDVSHLHNLQVSKVGAGSGPISMSDLVRFQSTSGGKYIQAKDGIVFAGGSVGNESKFKIKRLPYGGLHEVVGPDGVLMITLQREGEQRRSGYSLGKLEEAQIFPVEFPATDAKKAPYWELHLTCPLESETGTAQWCNDMGRLGQPGCRSAVEQAITDSHRRALVSAMTRESDYEWTAIIEDDVVPFQPEKFSDAFRQAWQGVPEEVKVVRLGWCTFESDLGEVKDRVHGADAGQRGHFKLVRERWWTDDKGREHYYTGGCTTGYMVHKSFIQEMLKIFPCCCPIDCCLERQLFYAPAKEHSSADDEWSKWRGHEIMIDMDGWSSRAYSKGFATFNQSGVLLQDNRNIQSERPEWNHVS